MSLYLLRVEAINLGNFVYDSQDLSTVRGGGLLLLAAVEQLATPTNAMKWKCLTTGASAGIYEFEAANLEAATAVCNAVKNTFANDSELQHATFAVSVQPKDNDQLFATKVNSLQALNRWQQMQSPSLSLSSVEAWQVCEKDLIRPATTTTLGPEGKTLLVSETVAKRREAGQRLKQHFYEAHIGRPLQRNFVHELNELTEDKTKGTLDGKMAVIYLDGNGFGSIKNSVRHSRAEWLGFDEVIQSLRRKMLDNLLDQMEIDVDWQTHNGRYRIETLLWGGDELMWIVPAWKGWETLQYFYEKSAQWKFNERQLRHSAGLVFCHHNASIHRITKLAKDLAELAKKKAANKIYLPTKCWNPSTISDAI